MKIQAQNFFYYQLVFFVFLFFIQDILALFFLKFGLKALVLAISGIKELFLIILLVQLVSYLGKASSFFRSKNETIAFFILMAFLSAYSLIGIIVFPIKGVIMELRALMMPVLLYFLGSGLMSVFNDKELYMEKWINLILKVSFFVAITAIIDYFFLSETFWRSLKVGDLEELRGGKDFKSDLPGNFFSQSFGRRALGIVFSPLLLSYLLIPVLVLFVSRRKPFKAFTTYFAIIISFSRLPIVASFVGLAYFKARFIVKILLAILVGIAFTIYLPKIMSVMTDISASSHYLTIFVDSSRFLQNIFGYGIGGAGIFATQYVEMGGESALFNMLNQVGIVGLLLYFLFFSYSQNRNTYLSKDVKVITFIYLLTIVMSPQIFVVKSNFIFFILLGMNKMTTEERLAYQN